MLAVFELIYPKMTQKFFNMILLLLFLFLVFLFVVFIFFIWTFKWCDLSTTDELEKRNPEIHNNPLLGISVHYFV